MNRFTALAAAASLMIILGCGREYHIAGTVVELAGASAKGSITEITGTAMPDAGTPVMDASITVFYELTADGSPVEKSTWRRTVKTGADGRFDLRDYSIPSEKLLVGIRIAKPGYEPLYTTYWDYKDLEPQVFFAVMRKL